MLKAHIGAGLLLIGLAAPALAQSRHEAFGDPTAPVARPTRHSDGARPHPYDLRPVKQKPRVCFRPDIGRYSRLIPYSC